MFAMPTAALFPKERYDSIKLLRVTEVAGSQVQTPRFHALINVSMCTYV